MNKLSNFIQSSKDQIAALSEKPTQSAPNKRSEGESILDNIQSEGEYYLDEERKIKNDLLNAELESKRQDIQERKKFALYIFFMICAWLIIILSIVLFQGFKLFNFSLSDTVIITLVTTTTANIAAYFLVVTKYLFPNNKD